MAREELTDKEELYAQKRAMGYTKTKAASIAYETDFPGALGYKTENREIVQKRIQELKDERAEIAGLDINEQIRKMNDLYLEALTQGKIKLAMEAQDRINQLAGFDVKRSASVTVKADSFKSLTSENGNDDIKKFSGLLEKHASKVIQGEIVKETAE